MFCANVEAYYNYRYLDIFKFKKFENLSVEKKDFRLRWDSSPGL